MTYVKVDEAVVAGRENGGELTWMGIRVAGSK